MALSILIGNAVFLRYLCRCNGKVCRCHIAPSSAWQFYVFTTGRYGKGSTDWLPGSSAFRTKEVLYGHCADGVGGFESSTDIIGAGRGNEWEVRTYIAFSLF